MELEVKGPATVAPPASPREALGSVSWLSASAPGTFDCLADHSLLQRAPSGVQLFEQAEIPSVAQPVVAATIELAAVRGQDETLIELQLRSAEERLGGLLPSVAEDPQGSTTFRLPVEKRLIASQLGTSCKPMSRVLPALQRFRVRVSGETLHIGDPSAARRALAYDPLIDGPEPIKPLSSQRIS